MGDDALSGPLAAAVRDRFVAVNGDHPMTDEDDAYVREHFVAATPEAMEQMLAGRLPLPSYVLSDGTPMVPAAHGELAEVAGGVDRLHDWFVAFWADDPATGEAEWEHYLSGQYVCLREVDADPDQERRPSASPRPRPRSRCCAATRTTRSGAECSARRSTASSPCPGSTPSCCR